MIACGCDLIKILNIVISTKSARGGGVRAGLMYGKYLSHHVPTEIAKMKGDFDNNIFYELGVSRGDVKILAHDERLKQIFDFVPFFPKRYSNVFIKMDIDDDLVNDFDVVHLHNPHPFFSMYQIARMCIKNNTPYFITMHGIPEMLELDKIVEMNSLIKIIYRKYIIRKLLYVLENSEYLFALTECDKELISSRIPNKQSDIYISPNGVEVSDFEIDMNGAEPIYDKYAIDDEIPILLFVGMMNERKGIDILIKSAKRLDASFQLLIVGPEIDKRISKEIDDLIDSDSRIKRLGYVSKSDLVYLYRMADIFIFPSLSEAFGMVLIEAMAARTPCIASDIPGPNRIIEDGTNGYLFPKGDICALTTRIESLLKNEDIMKEMGIAAHKMVKAKYNWDRIVKRNISLYKTASKSCQWVP